MKYVLLLNLLNMNYVWIVNINKTIQFRKLGDYKYIGLYFKQDISLEDKENMIKDFKSIINTNKKRNLTKDDIIDIINKYTNEDNIQIIYSL